MEDQNALFFLVCCFSLLLRYRRRRDFWVLVCWGFVCLMIPSIVRDHADLMLDMFCFPIFSSSLSSCIL